MGKLFVGVLFFSYSGMYFWCFVLFLPLAYVLTSLNQIIQEMQPPVQSGFAKRIRVFSFSSLGQYEWQRCVDTHLIPHRSSRGVAATDMQILLIRREITVGFSYKAIPEWGVVCNAALRPFLSSTGRTHWKLYSYTTKKEKKKTRQIDWSKRLKLTKGEETEGGGHFGFKPVDQPPDVLLSLFSVSPVLVSAFSESVLTFSIVQWRM